MKKLIDQMVNDLMACATDEYGPHAPEFEKGIHSSSGPDFSVCVEWSRDPSRSNNGGEYYRFRRYFIKNGSVHSYSVSSYEDSEPQGWTDHQVAIGMKGIEHCLQLACEKVLAELTPPVFDFAKVRRRVEDALRKTASMQDIAAIAGLLGVKTE